MKAGRAALLALAALAACRRGPDRAAEQILEQVIESGGREAEVAIDRDRGSITVQLGRATAPPGWPSGVPIYPHASRAKVEHGGGDTRRLWVASDDPVDDLAAFYRRELGSAGWQVEEGAPGARRWAARRGAESLRLRFVRRAEHGDSRAEIEYEVGS
ncbi:MAG: hypothetical protein HYY35_08555 [Deltaproteobacteria bacterium]|nr:hypothetical protein [Deltaproteobacteria bacterium]